MSIQHMGSYEGGTFVFTDGSKTAEGVGCAFVAGADTRSFSLPDHASVFSAELVAPSWSLLKKPLALLRLVTLTGMSFLQTLSALF